MDVAKAFGQVLRKIRQQQGVSQEDLALNCGLDRTFISLLERGLRQPSLSTVFQIANELDLDASEIVRQISRLQKRGSRRSLPRLPSSRP